MSTSNQWLKLYCDDKNTKHTNKNINLINITSSANIETIEEPTVVVDTKTGAYGIFDANKKLVQKSLQYRGKHHNFIPHKIPKDIPYTADTAIYVGVIYPHFGHFLVEQLNRLWGGIEKQKTDKLKWVFINNRNIDVKQFVYDFMAAFGVDKQDVIVLTHSARFRKIYIPSQTFNMSGATIDHAMVMGYRAMAQNCAKNKLAHDRIYMSRTKLPDTIRTLGEEQLEKIFVKNGYKIVYPETMTIAEQIATVANAKYLAGCSGTALHWALCMKPGGTVIALKTGRFYSHAIYDEHRCGIKFCFYNCIR